MDENERARELRFTVYGKPEPQGSVRAFMIGGRPRLTSDNAKLKPYRHSLTQVAMEEVSRTAQVAPVAPVGTPVALSVVWTLAKPKSTPKRVTMPTKKPDADKLLRAVLDSLTGVAYADDAQVVLIAAEKHYGLPERTEIHVRALAGGER